MSKINNFYFKPNQFAAKKNNNDKISFSGKSDNVSMFEGSALVLKNGEAGKSITTSLYGCQAVAVTAKTKDGGHICIMTHYPPRAVKDQAIKLKELINNNKWNFSDEPVSVIYALPENLDGSCNDNILNKLKESVHGNLKNISETVELYNESEMLSDHELEISMPQSQREPIRYRFFGEAKGVLN